MRRTDKEIFNKQELEDILSNNTICRLSLMDEKLPYLIPLNYGYQNRNITRLRCFARGSAKSRNCNALIGYGFRAEARGRLVEYHRLSM